MNCKFCKKSLDSYLYKFVMVPCHECKVYYSIVGNSIRNINFFFDQNNCIDSSQKPHLYSHYRIVLLNNGNVFLYNNHKLLFQFQKIEVTPEVANKILGKLIKNEMYIL